jgi:hypothetical protein
LEWKKASTIGLDTQIVVAYPSCCRGFAIFGSVFWNIVRQKHVSSCDNQSWRTVRLMRDDDVEALQAEVVWLVAILVEVLVEFLV